MTALAPHIKRRFRLEGFAALYIAGTKEPVAKRIGDNRGAWPISLGITTAYSDTITKHIDRHSPFWWNGVLFRVWCPNEEQAKILQRLVSSYMQKHKDADPLRKSWFDLGPAFEPKKFERAIRLLAKDHRITTWNDQELHDHLVALEARETKKVKRAFA